MKRRWVWIAVAAMLIVLPTVAAARPTGSHLRRLVPGRAILDYRFPGTRSLASTAAAAPGVKRFTATVVDGKKKFTYTLVGKNPAKAQKNPVTNVKTELIPIKIVLSNADTFDPTVADTCDTVCIGCHPRGAVTDLRLAEIHMGRDELGSGPVCRRLPPGGVPEVHEEDRRQPGLPRQPRAHDVARDRRGRARRAAADGTGRHPCGELIASIEINWFDDYLQTRCFRAVSSDVNPAPFRSSCSATW